MAKFCSDSFSVELRQEVKKFRAENRNLKGNFYTYLYYALVSSLVVVLHGNFYVIHYYYPAMAPLYYCLNAIALGLALSVFGLSVAHEINHGASFRSNKLSYFLGFSYDLVMGVSAFWWKANHINHHAHTNQIYDEKKSQDMDWQNLNLLRLNFAKSNMPDFIKKLLLFAGFSVASLQINFVLVKKIFKKFKISRKEFCYWLVFKTFFVGYTLLLPLWYFENSAAVVGIFIFVHLISSLGLFSVFAIAHTNSEVDTIERSNNLGMSWEKSQVITTANYALDSHLITVLHGGLNYQIEHHLFPDINPRHYPALSKIVRRLCEKHHVPYRAFHSTRDGLQSYIDWTLNYSPATEVIV